MIQARFAFFAENNPKFAAVRKGVTCREGLGNAEMKKCEKNFDDGSTESDSGSVDVVSALLSCGTSGRVQYGGTF